MVNTYLEKGLACILSTHHTVCESVGSVRVLSVVRVCGDLQVVWIFWGPQNIRLYMAVLYKPKSNL